MRLLDSSAEQQGRAILAGVAGNVMGWYDFTVYGYFAAVIGRQFFPAEDPISCCSPRSASLPRAF